MSEEKQFENDPERTLITLEQLSQTIEVMTSVVNRLRQHLSEQLHAQMEAQQEAVSKQVENADSATDGSDSGQQAAEQSPEGGQASERKESFVVEIRQQEGDDTGTDGKILH